MSPAVEVVRTYLELRSPDDLRPSRVHDARVHFVRHEHCPLGEYLRLYRDVGAEWQWRDRLRWTPEQLAALLESPNVAVWECVVDGESAGYFELARHDEGSVEIVYFGLMARFIGRGIGGAMLTRAVEEAWAFGANRVWLHTCTLDSPNALPNYRARGFTEFGVERYVAELANAL